MSCQRLCRPYKLTHKSSTQAKGKLSSNPMHAMAQEVPEVSVASSSTAANNWWETQVNPFSSWSAVSRRWPPPLLNHRSYLPSYDEANISISAAAAASSFANASNNSALSMDSSSADLSGEPVENHNIWNQVLLNVENSGEVHNSHDDGENFLEVLSSKRLSTEALEPAACSNLKKMDRSWEFHPSSLKYCLEKHLNSYNGSIMEPGRATNNLSDFVSNWAIAPPNTQLDQHIAPSTCNASIGPSMTNHLASDISHIKRENPIISSSYPGNVIVGESSTTTGYVPSYDHSMNQEGQCQDTGAATPFFLRSQNPSSTRYQIGHDDSTEGFNHTFCSEMPEVPWSNQRNLSDQLPRGGCLNKQAAMELRPSRPYVKGSDLCDGNKQGYESSSIKGSGRGTGAIEGKKKRSEHCSETLLKKSKYDNSVESSNKLQVPKVKMAEKISALQQLVSPFGKTDQASVLMETINCIKLLQEQIQLLSDPYLKSSVSKDHNSWGALERKDKAETKYDLRSKGLCLVPVSSIPQVHRESSRPDYWMPTYRSCSIDKLEPSYFVWRSSA